MNRDMEYLAETVAEAVKAYCANEFERRFTKALESFEERIRAMPAPKDGRDGADGRDGIDGKSVDLEEVRTWLKAEVDAIPLPKDGRDGVDGKDGAPGKDGAEGPQGPQGPQGDAGPAGADGLPGAEGPAGKDGAEGPAGRDGIDGAVGPEGPAGKDGAEGPQGPAGEAGAAGVDGKDGAPGEPGPAGPAGPAGIDGQDGATGPAGADGIDGPVGLDGRDGRDGKDGEAGRDAAHIDVQASIDASRSYPRGTYASHAGGLWRSFEPTSGMKGWECIVRGIDAATIEKDARDERAMTVALRLSDGKSEAVTTRWPVPKYREVYAAGQTYEPGDMVTSGGSLWHCNEATSDRPGDIGSKGWVLSVKRGRDGKDGKNGERGEVGKAGPPGRDLTQILPDGTRY